MFVEKIVRTFSTALVFAFAAPVLLAVVRLAVLVLVLVLVLPVLAMLPVLPVLVQISRCTHIGAHREYRVAEVSRQPVVFMMAALGLTMAVAVAMIAR